MSTHTLSSCEPCFCLSCACQRVTQTSTWLWKPTIHIFCPKLVIHLRKPVTSYMSCLRLSPLRSSGASDWMSIIPSVFLSIIPSIILSIIPSIFLSIILPAASTAHPSHAGTSACHGHCVIQATSPLLSPHHRGSGTQPSVEQILHPWQNSINRSLCWDSCKHDSSWPGSQLL